MKVISMLPSFSRAALGLAFAATLGLAGCQTVPDDIKHTNLTRTVLDAHPITVTEARADLAVAAPVHAAGITPADAARIAEFAGSFSRIGHGPIILSVPAGGQNAAAASVIAGQVRTILYNNGVNWDRIAGGAYDGSAQAEAPVTLAFVKYDAKAPECAPLSSVDLRRTNDNMPSAVFGCWSSNNLAVQIADPADLRGERPLDPVDAATRARVTKAYRNGEIKAPPSASASSKGGGR